MSILPLILVIDDELQMQRALRKILDQNGYRVLIAATGEDGLALAAANPPDAIILDLGLPDMDGIEVCEKLRAWTQTPVIVLSARDDQRQKVIALDRGADDYLTKPFGIEELMARLRVALRHGAQISKSLDPIVKSGGIEIDLARRVISRNGSEVRLTATEFKLLAHLARNADRVLTHRAILNEVWGMEYMDQVEYLRVYVRQLRAKLEDDPHHPLILLTEPGVGYRFVAQ